MLPIASIIRGASMLVAKNSPTILTALGAAGVISTAVLAVKATPEALHLLEEERIKRWDADVDGLETGEPIRMATGLEMVKIAWKPYIPAVLVGSAAVACIIGANTIGLRRNAALMSIYTLTEKALTEYQAKVVEVVGEHKAEQVKADIAQDHLNANPVSKSTVIITGKGDTLVFDEPSGRYFKSDIESIRKAENLLNKELYGASMVPWNRFYEHLEIDPIGLGWDLGWLPEEPLDVRFTAKIADDGTPCIVIDYKVNPNGFSYYR